MVLMHRGRAQVLQRREILAAVHHGSRMDQQIAIRPLLFISSAAGILAIDISDWFGADRKSDRTATVPTMARREQARVPESERVSAARRPFVQKPSTPPFPAYGLYSLYPRPRP